MSLEVLGEKDFILFVGEGDFSFAASYLRKNGKLKNEHIFASCLSSGPLNSKQEININFLEKNGAFVLFDVDATSLESHLVLNRYIFSKIYFNFPHVPKKMNLRDNRKLVQLFLKSAEKILRERGRILVTLCRGQGGTDIEVVKRDWSNTWKIVSLAADAGLILCDINLFNAKDFSSYECTGYRGLSKGFDTEGAITHVFCRGQILSHKHFQSVQNEAIESFVRDLRDIHKLMSKKQDSPCAKILSVLNNAIPFISTQNIFVPELLLCRKYFSCVSSNFENSNLLEGNLDSNRMEYCDECLSNLLSIFLKHKRPDVTTSIICSASCFANFYLSKPPFFHIASYFSSCEKSLMESLNSLCKLLKNCNVFSQSISPVSFWLDIGTEFEDITIAQQTYDIPSHISDVNISLYIHATCSIVKSDACIFYTDIDIKITNEKVLKSTDSTKYFEIGHIVKFSSNLKSYIGVLLNLDVICRLKFHVMDYRLLLLKEAYFTMQDFQGIPMLIFRSPSLYPPSYIHDVSFWIDENFDEKYFFMVIRNTVGYLIKSVTLIDLYYHKSTQRSSRCYRFEYQSCDKVVSKQSISEIHNCLMRKTIEKSLNVQMR